eukprot:GHVU01189021.1.p1 GENE.GHVU01189021.1~~GHVU01189021.1.p1  ORF type:complete len:134 (-),score=11.52 GHVU01189021.1:455-856(-)
MGLGGYRDVYECEKGFRARDSKKSAAFRNNFENRAFGFCFLFVAMHFLSFFALILLSIPSIPRVIGTFQWEEVKVETTSIGKRFGSAAAAVDGDLYAVGGCEGSKCFNDLWKFDSRKKKWGQMPVVGDIPDPR